MSSATPPTMLGADQQPHDTKDATAMHARGSSYDNLSVFSSPYTVPSALGARSLAPSISLLESKGGRAFKTQDEEEDEEEDGVNGDSRQLDDSEGHGILSTTVPITPASLAGRFLVRWPTIASVAVTLYDLLMRLLMTSYYIVGLDAFTSPEQYLKAKALKQSRRYVESCSAKYDAALEAGEVSGKQPSPSCPSP
jgi:hypothetical protein